jgi:hypothetical protein
MKTETLKKIFEFLEENDNRKTPFLWKLFNNEPLTEDDLHIKGDLNLSETPIESLPNGLVVSGDLILSECESLRSLPKGLKVGGSLDLSYSLHLDSLPNGLVVGGDLILSGCESLDSLPEGLKVGGELHLDNSDVYELPKGLEIGGDLIVTNSALEEYSDKKLRKMIQPGFIKGKIFYNNEDADSDDDDYDEEDDDD